MNANVVTSTFIERAKVPMILASDEEALQTAVRCNWGVPPEETRFVRIPNTLHLEYLYVSENLLDEVLQNAEAEVVGDPENVRFDAEGYLEGF
jgi:non-ribosomal peptide synthetase component F